MVMCVVRDIRADVYGNPFFLQSTGQAIRQFSDEVNRADEQNVMYKHPEDFELFLLGSFDCTSAKFELCDRVQIAEGSSCVKKRASSPAQISLVQEA